MFEDDRQLFDCIRFRVPLGKKPKGRRPNTHNNHTNSLRPHKHKSHSRYISYQYQSPALHRFQSAPRTFMRGDTRDGRAGCVFR